MKRRANRVDENHGIVRDGMRDAGAVVEDTSGVGNGFPDTVVSFRGVIYYMEIKDGSKPPSATKLTPAQIKFRDRQLSVDVVLNVVYDLDQALRVIGARRTA